MEKNISLPKLIGVSGKAGSGKDLVGSMIQYLSLPELYRAKAQFNPDTDYSRSSSYQVKKFAGKLKQISALLLGVSVDAFEDRDFKNSELPEMWHYWSAVYRDPYTDEVAQHTFTYSPPLVLEDRGYTWNLMEHSVKHRRMTGRDFLLLMGTDAARDNVHPNIWVNALFADYIERKPKVFDSEYLTERYSFTCKGCEEESIGYKRQSYCKECAESMDFYPSWVVTDMRFPNELQAIQQRGGLTIRVNRKLADSVDHISDRALDNAKFDIVLDNNGSINDLLNNLINALQHFEEQRISL